MKSLDIAPLGGYRAEDVSNWKASKQGATLIVTLPCWFNPQLLQSGCGAAHLYS